MEKIKNEKEKKKNVFLIISLRIKKTKKFLGTTKSTIIYQMNSTNFSDLINNYQQHCVLCRWPMHLYFLLKFTFAKESSPAACIIFNWFLSDKHHTKLFLHVYSRKPNTVYISNVTASKTTELYKRRRTTRTFYKEDLRNKRRVSLIRIVLKKLRWDSYKKN